VVPSEWEETFGLVVIEAMASGVPAVASARGSLAELITHDVDGILFEPGSVSALSRVLMEIDETPERFAKLGAQARRTYKEKFDSGHNLEQLLFIYRFAIEHPVWSDQARTEDPSG
jgi:glycosyltransferase involved in cell wall biosynthesis